jgi:hypothetical protein
MTVAELIEYIGQMSLWQAGMIYLAWRAANFWLGRVFIRFFQQQWENELKQFRKGLEEYNRLVAETHRIVANLHRS